MREWERVEGTYWSWAVILLELPPIVSIMEVCEGGLEEAIVMAAIIGGKGLPSSD